MQMISKASVHTSHGHNRVSSIMCSATCNSGYIIRMACQSTTTGVTAIARRAGGELRMVCHGSEGRKTKSAIGIEKGRFCLCKRVFTPYSLGFKRSEHSSAPGDGSGTRNRTSDFVRRILEEDGNRSQVGLQSSRRNVHQDIDVVHFKLMKNNTFVTVTDSKGNKKIGASAGCLPEMRGGPKMSRYAAEATAEHVGRMSRSLGLKSVVMRVNGFTHFKKKRQAIMSWREGFMNSRGDHPITYVEDTTRLPHNGCRLPKKRRI